MTMGNPVFGDNTGDGTIDASDKAMIGKTDAGLHIWNHVDRQLQEF